MMKKRLTALIAALIMLLTSISANAALTMDDVIFELNTLGIMEGDGNGDFQLEKPVTRAEFAAIVSRMLNMENTAAAYKNEAVYDDVAADHWANGYIVMLTNLGIISGTGNNKFSPDEYLSYENISKMLVCALGYSIQAESAGGYPGGYTATAQNLELLKGVTISYPFTREATARMVYNALYVKIMSREYAGNDVDYVITDTTLRDKFKAGDDGSVEKHEGIVTATVDAYTSEANPSMEENQIEIDDKLYYINDENSARYIGQKVVYYINTEEDNRILSLRPSKDDNEIITVSVKDLKDFETDSITYFTEGNSTKTKKINASVIFLNNNRPDYEWNPDDILRAEKGSVTLINNTKDQDNDVDIILYKTHESVVIDDVNVERNMIYFSSNTPFNGNQYIDVDVDRNSDKRIAIYKADGTRATAADVVKDNVLSITQSADKTFVEAIISDQYVEGKITSSDGESIVLNGEEYTAESDSVLKNLIYESDVRVYLNYLGEAVYIKEITASSNYGYVTKLFTDDAGSNYGTKMIIPSTLQEKKEEEENEDGGEATVVSKIIARNEELRNMYFASSVYISGLDTGSAKKYTSEGAAAVLQNKAIKYSLNSSGEIYSAEVLQPERGGTSKVYNSYERTFGKGNGSNTEKGGFGVDFETRTICVPEADDPSADDYLALVEMANGKTYNVISYEMNEDRHMMDLIVVTAPMKYSTVGELTTSSDVGFVTNVATAFDEENNEETVVITMLADGVEKEYEITEAYKNYEKYTVPSKGCLVAYLLDNDGKIENLRVVKNYGTKNLAFGLDAVDPNYNVFVGYALTADYNFVSNTSNRWVTRLGVDAGLIDEPSLYYEVFKNNPPPVFIYNSMDKSAEYGDIRAVAVGSDVMSVFSTNGKVRAVVVIR